MVEPWIASAKADFEGYRGIMLDPPWPEVGGGKCKRGADRHYDVLKVRDMPRVIYGSGMFVPAEHAHIYMWVTNNYLPSGLWLMEALGVTYKTNLVWEKDRAGLGQYFRGEHELVLFGIVGSGKDESVYQDTRSLGTRLKGEHKRIHSRKPETIFERIEKRTKGPYLEMFGDPDLPVRPGWVQWGNPRRAKPE